MGDKCWCITSLFSLHFHNIWVKILFCPRESFFRHSTINSYKAFFGSSQINGTTAVKLGGFFQKYVEVKSTHHYIKASFMFKVTLLLIAVSHFHKFGDFELVFLVWWKFENPVWESWFWFLFVGPKCFSFWGVDQKNPDH